MAGKRIVLTADRSLMTNYRGNFLYGFIACGPYEVLPEWVFDKVFCPAVETDPITGCLLYTSPSPRDGLLSRMPSSA